MRTLKHTTRDGKKIPLKKMTDQHLLNMIALIQRSAENGMRVGAGGGGDDPDDMWYDEGRIEYGESVFQGLNYSKYITEATLRKLKFPTPPALSLGGLKRLITLENEDEYRADFILALIEKIEELEKRIEEQGKRSRAPMIIHSTNANL